jgi:hypothetical protein
VGIEVYATGTTTLIASGATDATGLYLIPEVEQGNYDLAVLVHPRVLIREPGPERGPPRPST